MAYELKRAAAATNHFILRFVLVFAAGAYLIWAEVTEGSFSPLWMGFGVLFVAWSCFLLYNILRPVLLRLDAQGVYGQSVFGTHAFAWDALKWVDFTRPQGAGVLCYSDGAKERFVILSRKAVSDAERSEILRNILEFRADVPTKNPEPFVELRSPKP